MDLTHFDQDGNAWMVDVSDKDITTRTAVAEGFIAINDAIYERIEAGTIKKGMFLVWLNWQLLWGRNRRVISFPFVIR